MSEKNDNDSHYEELSGDAGQKRIYDLIKGIHIANGCSKYAVQWNVMVPHAVNLRKDRRGATR
jgi:hypothetical protein